MNRSGLDLVISPKCGSQPACTLESRGEPLRHAQACPAADSGVWPGLRPIAPDPLIFKSVIRAFVISETNVPILQKGMRTGRHTELSDWSRGIFSKWPRM